MNGLDLRDDGAGPAYDRSTADAYELVRQWVTLICSAEASDAVVQQAQELGRHVDQLGPRAADGVMRLLREFVGVERVMVAGFTLLFAQQWPGTVSKSTRDLAWEVVFQGIHSDDGREQYWGVCYLPDLAMVPDCVPRLETLMQSDRPTIAVCAAAVLAKQRDLGTSAPGGSVDAVRVLKRSLTSEDGYVRAVAAKGFLAVGLEDVAVPHLATALAGQEGIDLHCLITTLMVFGEKAAEASSALWRVACDESLDLEMRGYAARAVLCVMADLNRVSAELAKQALSSKVESVRRGALRGLLDRSHVPDSAVPDIADALSCEDFDTRFEAVCAIAKLGHERARAFVDVLFERAAWENNVDMGRCIAVALAVTKEASDEPLMRVLRTLDLRRLPLVGMVIALRGAEARLFLDRAIRALGPGNEMLIVLLLRDLAGDVEPFVPMLGEWLVDAELAACSETIARLLADLGLRATPAIPALVRCVAEGNPEAAFHARAALRAFGAVALESIEQFRVTADAEGRRRLEEIGGSSSGQAAEPEFLRLLEINRDILRLFRWMGDELIGTALSFQALSDRLRTRQVAGEIPADVRLGYKTLATRLRDIEHALGDKRLTDRRARSKGGLTAYGRRMYGVVTRFLAWVDTRA